MGKKLGQALAEADEFEAAESDQSDQTIPAHVKVNRPNRPRSKVLQVRLSPEEFDAVERIAASRALPASTVAREQLLAMIREAEPTNFGSHLGAELDAAVTRVRELLSLVPVSTRPS